MCVGRGEWIEGLWLVKFVEWVNASGWILRGRLASRAYRRESFFYGLHHGSFLVLARGWQDLFIPSFLQVSGLVSPSWFEELRGAVISRWFKATNSLTHSITHSLPHSLSLFLSPFSFPAPSNFLPFINLVDRSFRSGSFCICLSTSRYLTVPYLGPLNPTLFTPFFPPLGPRIFLLFIYLYISFFLSLFRCSGFLLIIGVERMNGWIIRGGGGKD